MGIIRTLRLWKLVITASAPALSGKAISATTLGTSRVIRQLVISPPMGVMVLSISATVVPAAKFRATTTNGPLAVPRMLMPFPGVLVLLRKEISWVFEFEARSESVMFSMREAETARFSRRVLPGPPRGNRCLFCEVAWLLVAWKGLVGFRGFEKEED